MQVSNECSAYIWTNWHNNRKGEDSDPNLQGNGEKAHAEKRDNCIYTTILSILVMVTTSQRFRTEVYNMKQEGPERKPTKSNQNKENRNTRTRQQWKHRATRKQKINGYK